MKRLTLLSIFAALLACRGLEAQNKDALPMIGAQIIVEPWQSEEEVDLWFRSMKENGMTVCRIRMFEEYMKQGDGSLDFHCFDVAFDAAERYGIKVFATLFPMAYETNTLGGFKHPANRDHMAAISRYVSAVVNHYKDHPALYGWVLMNEPGTGGILPSDRFTSEMLHAWEGSDKSGDSWTRGYTSDIFNRQRYLVEHNTWYISWLAEQVRRYDRDSEIHINNHQIFDNVAEYDFPAWRHFLTSLGGSAHPSWHFDYFPRQRYVMAMGANCRIIRSGAGNLPFWITEMQGGTNTYSGNRAFCPTAEEISQWLWTSIASGAKGVIFWCYNPRTVGEEAGEWAMINNDNTNSDRLDAVREVARCLEKNAALFASARPIDSHINVIYIRESLWAERNMQYDVSKESEWEGRQKGGVIKSAIGVYEALLSCGINANFKEMAEYDWTRNDYRGEVVILANQIAVPTYRMAAIRHFVEHGGRLIVEGLTGFYDENLTSLNNVGRPLADLFGGILAEVKTTPGDFRMGLPADAPVHLWKGLVSNVSGTVLSCDETGAVTSIRHGYGKGETVWLPSLVSLGARRSGEYAPLAAWLKKECNISQPFFFETCEPEIMMTLMETDREYIAVLVNKSAGAKKIRLHGVSTSGRILFSDKGGKINRSRVFLPQEGTIVSVWQKEKSVLK